MLEFLGVLCVVLLFVDIWSHHKSIRSSRFIYGKCNQMISEIAEIGSFLDDAEEEWGKEWEPEYDDESEDK